MISNYLSACAAGTPAPASQPASTQAPSETPTAVPSPTSAPSPTAMPEMPTGPFKWSGQTRPLLMAHYMPWYQVKAVGGSWGWHWSMNYFLPQQGGDGQWKNLASHYTPLTGPYDSSDEAVLEYQVQLMKLSGIDGVIVDWYGMKSFNDYGMINENTGKLFQVIKKAGLKFVICYEDATIKNMIAGAELKEADAIAQAQEVMQYLQNTWFNDDAYLKVNGQPMLFVFGPRYFKSGGDWKTIFSVNRRLLPWITPPSEPRPPLTPGR